jgi:hypothetical protein
VQEPGRAVPGMLEPGVVGRGQRAGAANENVTLDWRRLIIALLQNVVTRRIQSRHHCWLFVEGGWVWAH